MKIKINNNGYSQHESLLKRSISGRIPVDFTDGEMCIELYQDKSIGGEESYEILQSGDTWRIVGADKLGLYYGIGKFLPEFLRNEFLKMGISAGVVEKVSRVSKNLRILDA